MVVPFQCWNVQLIFFEKIRYHLFFFSETRALQLQNRSDKTQNKSEGHMLVASTFLDEARCFSTISVSRSPKISTLYRINYRFRLKNLNFFLCSVLETLSERRSFWRTASRKKYLLRQICSITESGMDIEFQGFHLLESTSTMCLGIASALLNFCQTCSFLLHYGSCRRPRTWEPVSTQNTYTQRLNCLAVRVFRGFSAKRFGFLQRIRILKNRLIFYIPIHSTL